MLEIGAMVWGVRDVGRAVDFLSAALHNKLKYTSDDNWAVVITPQGQGIQR